MRRALGCPHKGWRHTRPAGAVDGVAPASAWFSHTQLCGLCQTLNLSAPLSRLCQGHEGAVPWGCWGQAEATFAKLWGSCSTYGR